MSNPNHMPARLAAFALAMGLAGAANAGSNASAIVGKANPGDVAIITNLDTGVTRELEVKDNGKYQLRNLQSGNYSVVIKHPDGSLDAPRVAELHIGATTKIL